MELAELVYAITGQFPRHEQYGLTAQTRRAVVSVSSNIAEGAGRWSAADFARHVTYAMGSLNEVESQLLLAERLGFTSSSSVAKAHVVLRNARRLCMALRAKLYSNTRHED